MKSWSILSQMVSNIGGVRRGETWASMKASCSPRLSRRSETEGVTSSANASFCVARLCHLGEREGVTEPHT